MWSIYIIQSSIHKKCYTGMTEDVEKRLKQHNAGIVKSTKSGVPWKLRFLESGFLTPKSARTREKYWKRDINKKRLESNNWKDRDEND